MSVVAFLLLGTTEGLSFALLGPCRAPACSAGGTWAQPFDQEFRWSIPVVTVAPSPSFVEAWGDEGVAALDRSLRRWERAFALDPAETPDRTDVPSLETGIVYDLESILVHELGHALGLAHPDQAAGGGKNYAPDGTPIPSTWHELMFSALPNATLVRAPTSDDVAGIRYLYSPDNVNPGDGAGVGAVRFALLDPSAAVEGTGAGAHVDIFATTQAEHPDLFPGGALGAASVAFHAEDPDSDPGIINGLDAWDPVVGGVDIFLNLSRPLEILHPVPEPGVVFLVLTAWGAVRRRRLR